MTQRLDRALAFGAFLLTGLPSLAEEPLPAGACMERFETREGKFVVHFRGVVEPREFEPAEADVIRKFPPCDPIRDASPSVKLGIYGSNAIGDRLMPMLISAYADKKLSTARDPSLSSPRSRRSRSARRRLRAPSSTCRRTARTPSPRASSRAAP